MPRDGEHFSVLLATAIAVAAALALGCTGAGTVPAGSGGSGSTIASGSLTSSGATASGEQSPSVMPGGQKVPLTVYYSVETTVAKGGKAVRGEALVGVRRYVPSGTWLLADAPQLWLSGPTAAEAANGLALAARPGLQPRGVKLAKNVVWVDLPKAIEPAGGTAATVNLLGQLVYTMTDLPGVKSVRIKIDGTAASTFGSEGFDISKPLTRASFKAYFPQQH